MEGGVYKPKHAKDFKNLQEQRENHGPDSVSGSPEGINLIGTLISDIWPLELEKNRFLLF